jgi:hypothetical protein
MIYIDLWSFAYENGAFPVRYIKSPRGNFLPNFPAHAAKKPRQARLTRAVSAASPGGQGGAGRAAAAEGATLRAIQSRPSTIAEATLHGKHTKNYWKWP